MVQFEAVVLAFDGDVVSHCQSSVVRLSARLCFLRLSLYFFTRARILLLRSSSNLRFHWLRSQHFRYFARGWLDRALRRVLRRWLPPPRFLRLLAGGRRGAPASDRASLCPAFLRGILRRSRCGGRARCWF